MTIPIPHLMSPKQLRTLQQGVASLSGLAGRQCCVCLCVAVSELQQLLCMTGRVLEECHAS